MEVFQLVCCAAHNKAPVNVSDAVALMLATISKPPSHSTITSTAYMLSVKCV